MFSSEVTSLSPAAAPPRSAPHWQSAGTVVALGCLWIILIDQLRVDWAINPQYNFGWLVPFLTLYLFWKRWTSRPPPSRPQGLPALAIGAGMVALALFPVRLIQESAPYWALVSWALALQVIGLTLAALTFMGGWNWARHFAAPVCFFLVAVPWPSDAETAMTQGLMHYITAVTVELLNWAGVDASANGNVIRLSTGMVGVDEACSGVRSLHSMLMASLFLGELNLLSWLGRGALIFAGLALALLCNLIRALALVVVASRSGLSALETWHDPAGFTILVITFAGLCLLVWLFGGWKDEDPARAPSAAWRAIPSPWLIGFGVWMVLTEVGTEAWYRSHESPAVLSRGWTFQPPETLPTYQERAVSEEVRKILACDRSYQGVWRESDGNQWVAYFFKWHPTQSSRQAARFHRPEVCLPATGRRLVEERPRVTVRIGELALSFRSYLFDNNGQPLHVFFSLREGRDGEVESAEMMADSRAARLRRAWDGRRDLGQQSIEVIIFGMESPAEAEAAFRERIAQMVVPVSPAKPD